MELRRGYFTMNDFISKSIDEVDVLCNDITVMSLTKYTKILSDCKLECKPNCLFNSIDLFSHFEDKNSHLNKLKYSSIVLFLSSKFVTLKRFLDVRDGIPRICVIFIGGNIS